VVINGTKPRLGVVFPAREIGTDVRAVREWTSGIQDLGFSHVAVPDHVLGVNPEARTDDWQAQWPHTDQHVRVPYTHLSEFHEPFVLLAYLAALSDVELVTGVLVLPQRQTVLVAKQAAELALLCGGRLRLGVGIGWNPAEYEALGMPFRERGRLVEEQVPLLRRLWQEETLEEQGEFHRLHGVGLAPRPGPIPIWMGGGTSFARGIDALRRPLERIGRLAEGWYLDSAATPVPELRQALEVVQEARTAAGRGTAPIPLDGRILLATCPTDDDVVRRAEAWLDVPASHITVDSMGTGCTTPSDHLRALERVRRLVEPVTKGVTVR
jgi:probable F420-dependent oxidoreductase